MAKAEPFLAYQEVLRSHTKPGTGVISLRGLGVKAEVENSTLSRATSKPGYQISRDVAKRLYPLVPGLEAAMAFDFGMTPGEAGQPAPLHGPGIVWLRPDQLLRWEKNPRKTFAPEDIEGLAVSILERGVLQNLTVREFSEGKPAFGYQIGAGERRWRAAQHLVQTGRKPADEAFLPCRIIQAKDEEFLAIAILENLQRVEVPPLEEAEGLAALQEMNPKYWSTLALADKLGKSEGYVLQRLQLARKLAPEAKTALQDGTLTFDKARQLVRVAPEIQTRVVEKMRAGDRHLLGTTDLFNKELDYHAAIAPKPQADRPPPPAGADMSEDDDTPSPKRASLSLPGSGWTFSPAKGRKIVIHAADEETQASILTALEKACPTALKDAA
jgi:ParB/RepB/Spo0J family partition protein